MDLLRKITCNLRHPMGLRHIVHKEDIHLRHIVHTEDIRIVRPSLFICTYIHNACAYIYYMYIYIYAYISRHNILTCVARYIDMCGNKYMYLSTHTVFTWMNWQALTMCITDTHVCTHKLVGPPDLFLVDICGNKYMYLSAYYIHVDELVGPIHPREYSHIYIGWTS